MLSPDWNCPTFAHCSSVCIAHPSIGSQIVDPEEDWEVEVVAMAQKMAPEHLLHLPP